MALHGYGYRLGLVLGCWLLASGVGMAADELAQLPGKAATAGLTSDGPDTVSVQDEPPVQLKARIVMSELRYGQNEDDPVGHSTKNLNLERRGQKLHLSSNDPTESLFVPELIYDYEQGLYYQRLESDDIFFSYQISGRERVRAQIYRWLRIPESEPTFRLEVNRNLTFDGHPTTLVLTGFVAGGRIHAMHWVWEAQDLDGLPVRVVFGETPDLIRTVEYYDIRLEDVPESRVTVPEGIPVMTGF